LLLATSQQMTKCPQSWCVTQTPTNQDVMGKVALLEKALADSLELQKEQMRHVKDEISALRSTGPRTPGIPVITLNPDTPSTKKRKLNEALVTESNQEASYASMAGISPLGLQQQQGIQMLQSILQKQQPAAAPKVVQKKNICYGSARVSKEGVDDTKLSADVSFVASGVAKDCTTDMLKDFLANRGINAVEVEQLTKKEVLPQVRTLTFRVAVKAADYEAALNPEVWPFRVGVRHYRPPRRGDKQEGGWQSQSGRSGGNVDTDNRGARGGLQHHGGGTPAGGQRFPPGHPGRVGHQPQNMGPRQPGPVDISNFFGVLSALGSGMGIPTQ
jgi:hypothetical protein